MNTYTYDSANRLIGASDQSTVSSYQYNGLGDRLSQTVNGVPTNYTLDLNSGLTQVLDDRIYSYTYGTGRISQQQGTTPEYFLGDALGSVRQLTDQSSAITLSKSYDPYGNVVSSTGDSTSVFAYTGEQMDSYSELIYLRSRLYSPETGRFTAKDIWGGHYSAPQSLNKWNYTVSNPVNYIDPSGLCVNCYVFFFPGLGNNGDADGNGIIDGYEIGVGEKRVVDQIRARTGARVTVMYPYGTGLAGNLSAEEKYTLIYNLAKEKSSLLKYKAQEILGWLILGLQLDSHLELCYDGFDDEQLNITFVGYSGGGQVAYSTAQALSGTLFVDNLVLFGAPYRAHDGLGNIGQLWNFVSEQDDIYYGIALDKAGIPAIAWELENFYSGLYSENATICTLYGDDNSPYIHYDEGNTDYFGTNANFNGQGCYGAHEEQSVTRERASQLGFSRFEANMAMLFGIIEEVVK